MPRMAKCPRCLSRKGKRYCPALRTSICPLCCAEERLKTIACPSDCEHLAGERYQHNRRKERALSQGKAFVDQQNELFMDPTAREFTFKLQADIFFFSSSFGAVSDTTLAETLDSLRSLSSRIFVPGRSPHPIFGFLAERLGDAKRYPTEKGLGPQEKASAVGKLAAHVRELARGASSAEPSFRHHEVISSFFGALDFESDLDYSPDDARNPVVPHPHEPEPGRRSPGGLILP